MQTITSFRQHGENICFCYSGNSKLSVCLLLGVMIDLYTRYISFGQVWYIHVVAIIIDLPENGVCLSDLSLLRSLEIDIASVDIADLLGLLTVDRSMVSVKLME